MSALSASSWAPPASVRAPTAAILCFRACFVVIREIHYHADIALASQPRIVPAVLTPAGYPRFAANRPGGPVSRFPAESGNGGFPRFPIPAESGIGDSLPEIYRGNHFRDSSLFSRALAPPVCWVLDPGPELIPPIVLPSPFLGQIGNRGNVNWGFPGLRLVLILMIGCGSRPPVLTWGILGSYYRVLPTVTRDSPLAVKSHDTWPAPIPPSGLTTRRRADKWHSFKILTHSELRCEEWH
jgi:hypothetical protein